MVRAMYSGVAGMKSHQTKLDVIGNNVANVNTYGFKSSRATFRDMYYQQLRGASAGTTNRGGISPSSVGYGSQLASIDLMMTQSQMSPTGNPLDVCITGEGFLQVQDADGNIFYTKAGMLDIDPATGTLIDTNGYFVLGTGNPGSKPGGLAGKAPGSNKIMFDIPAVDPAVSEYTGNVNGIEINVSATNRTNAGNVSFNFAADTSMTLGTKAKAIIDGGSITIRLNANETFTQQQLNEEVNKAITLARDGEEHPAGEFSFSFAPSPFDSIPGGVLTGDQLVTAASGNKRGQATITGGPMWGGFSIIDKSMGTSFAGDGTVAYSIVPSTTLDADGNPTEFTITATVTAAQGSATGGGIYTAKISSKSMPASAGVALTKTGGESEDSLVLKVPSLDSVKTFLKSLPNNEGYTPADPTTGDPEVYNWAALTTSAAATGYVGTAKPFEPNYNVGLSNTLKLTGGTEGGPQSVEDLSAISIGADGTIVASHGILGRLELGRIDLANFGNPKGLEQAGNSYFSATANSGTSNLAVAGEDGTGALKNSALEMSNVDLSQEFTEMITAQRGFQANSRMITVSDTLLEELINLKR